MSAYNNEEDFTEDPKGQMDLANGKGWSHKCITRRSEEEGVSRSGNGDEGEQENRRLKSETPPSTTTFRGLNINHGQWGGRPLGNLNSRVTLFPDEPVLI